jgi:hypothetical protein
MSSNPNLQLDPKDDARFEILKSKAETNWRVSNPKLVARLEKNNQLERALDTAASLTIKALNQCEEAGLAPDQAREIAYENLLLPSSELAADED